MGKKGREIIEVDAAEVVKLLNKAKAVADEWASAYYYWFASEVLEGVHYPVIAEMLNKQSTEELSHASKLAKRILELGGTPLESLGKLVDTMTINYPVPPSNRADVKGVIERVLELEAAAISFYNDLAKKTFGKDHVTYELVTGLLADEVSDEEGWQNLLTEM